MTDTVNNIDAAPEVVVIEEAVNVVPHLDLGSLLDGAISRAVETQIAGAAKGIAAEVVAAMLTPEVLAGMRESAILAATAALDPAPEPEEEDGETEQGQDEQPAPPPEPEYETVEEFVEGYIATLYRREVSERGTEKSARWCESWWAHGEVYARMEALHSAFEHLRLGATVEQSTWWLVHLDQMMDRILDPEGPFKCCSVFKGHSDDLGPLPTKPAPARRADGSYEDTHAPTRIYVPPAAPARRQVVKVIPDPDFP